VNTEGENIVGQSELLTQRGCRKVIPKTIARLPSKTLGNQTQRRMQVAEERVVDSDTKVIDTF